MDFWFTCRICNIFNKIVLLVWISATRIFSKLGNRVHSNVQGSDFSLACTNAVRSRCEYTQVPLAESKLRLSLCLSLASKVLCFLNAHGCEKWRTCTCIAKRFEQSLHKPLYRFGRTVSATLQSATSDCRADRSQRSRLCTVHAGSARSVAVAGSLLCARKVQVLGGRSELWLWLCRDSTTRSTSSLCDALVIPDTSFRDSAISRDFFPLLSSSPISSALFSKHNVTDSTSGWTRAFGCGWISTGCSESSTYLWYLTIVHGNARVISYSDGEIEKSWKWQKSRLDEH